MRPCHDRTAADRQPLVTAKFSEPGLYDSKDPMRFDLSWLGHPAEARWRWIRTSGSPDEIPEIELRYGNGYRLVLADARLAGLPARGAKPIDEADLLHLTFGIGTPEIYANVDERLREMESERPAYLFLLDAKGNLVDNHHAGIALVGHLSFAWPGAITAPAPAGR